MQLINPYKRTDLIPEVGRLLIAEPFLSDQNFLRSVVYICDHGPEGTVGFSLNRQTDLVLSDLIPELDAPDLPVFHGGPVQVDTLHILHRIPHLLGGVEVSDGVYWGGAFEALKRVIQEKKYKPSDMKILVGYAGWGQEQITRELEEKSWLVAESSSKLLFETPSKELWRTSIESIGHEFSFLAHLPLSPQLN